MVIVPPEMLPAPKLPDPVTLTFTEAAGAGALAAGLADSGLGMK